MSTTVEAIYEQGIFKPVSGLPVALREHERVMITIITDDDAELRGEFEAWEAASDEDLVSFERRLEESD